MPEQDTGSSSQAGATPALENPIFITLVIAAAFFMELFDSTVIVTALPTMAHDFNTSIVALSLGLTAYMLSTAVLLPASGWIADRYGTRTVFCTATAIFVLSSIWCGLSRGVNEFVLARCVQGIGAALMSPVGRLVVLRATPKEQLVRVMNLMVVPALIGPVLGPSVGGLITTYASWRWCFFINVPIGLTILYLVYRHSPNLRSEDHHDFDYRGFALNALCLSGLIYGMNQLAEQWPGNPLSLSLIALGVVLAWFAVRHANHATQPLVSLRALDIHSFKVSVLTGGGVFRLAMAGPIFLMPLMFQVGLGMSAFLSGMMILTHTGGDLLTKIFTQRFLNWAGFRRAFISTTVVFVSSLALCACFTTATSYWWIGLVLFIAGSARSLQMSAQNSLQFADVTYEQMTDASTLAGIIQQVQRAMGVTLGAIVLNFAVSLRGDITHTLTQFDFQVGFAVMSVLGLASMLWFLPLPKTMGAHLLGDKKK
ncbi:MAG: MFS transporter [Steroidobacteraceae bacterium]